MHETETVLRSKAGRVVYAIRKFHGYGQMEISKDFRVSQSNVSKIESGILAPDLRLWMELTRAFKVKDPYCFYYGSAEIENIPQLSKVGKSFYKGTGFKIPKHYLSDPLITSRKMRPLIDVFEASYEKAWNKFLTDTKIPQGIFDILNFPIPALMVKDMADFMQTQTSKLDISKDLNLMSQINHGLLFEDYAHFSTPVSVLKHFIHKQRDYGIDFEYTLSEEKGCETTVSVQMSPQLLNVVAKKDLNANKFFNFSAQYPLLLMKSKGTNTKAASTGKVRGQEMSESLWKLSYA
ncbi:MAG: helix-turn-helix transcriptional regulator [Bdellovibrio sp.]|nr:helix-turn-helix transcriptional regulator [Bdellovibrio sp.]